ncbi:hypothetical protein ACOTVS_11975 [Aliarcobacter butzleri]|uniref:hypothetical protein n=1 Tax=Aliarcobacter butzleri TaxID=28197 RepID=UPI0034503140
MKKNTILIDNTNQHETISFSISNLELSKKESFLELAFIPNADKVYRTSDYKTVLYPPAKIELKLNDENILMLCACLISSISLHFKEESLFDFGNEFSTDLYFVKMRKVYKEETKDKIIFDIFLSKENKQLISFSLNKTKIILLLFLIKDSFLKIEKNFNFLVASKNFLFNVTKGKDNSLGINGIWLRNSEIEILNYIANSIIFDFKFEKRFKEYKKIHRQLLIFMNSNNEMVISIKQYNKKTNHLHFVLNSQVVSALYLSKFQTIAINKEDEND